jgi:hypothetical protein
MENTYEICILHGRRFSPPILCKTTEVVLIFKIFSTIQNCVVLSEKVGVAIVMLVLVVSNRKVLETLVQEEF